MKAHLLRFLWSEEGSSTIEFVVVAPILFAMFMSTVELGVVMTRQAMLERGLDIAVRDVRLGLLENVTHDNLRDLICDNTLMIPNCRGLMRLEMVPRNPRAWTNLPATADCVNRAQPAQPVRNFTAGPANQLMVLRACVLFQPWFPTSGLGARLPRVDSQYSALVATASFVVEPN